MPQRLARPKYEAYIMESRNRDKLRSAAIRIINYRYCETRVFILWKRIGQTPSLMLRLIVLSRFPYGGKKKMTRLRDGETKQRVLRLLRFSWLTCLSLLCLFRSESAKHEAYLKCLAWILHNQKMFLLAVAHCQLSLTFCGLSFMIADVKLLSSPPPFVVRQNIRVCRKNFQGMGLGKTSGFHSPGDLGWKCGCSTSTEQA